MSTDLPPRDDNPLLDFSARPAFDRIEARHVEPAIDALLARARAAVAATTAESSAGARAEGAAADWEHVVAPTETPLDELDRAFAIVAHLNAVAGIEGLRAAYTAVLPRVTAFHAELEQNERLHARYRKLADGPAMTSLAPAQQRVVRHALRDFRLGGAHLDAARKARLGQVREELAILTSRFDDNILDAEDRWTYDIDDETLLAGVPADAKAAARDAARAAGVNGFRLTLRAPCYQPVLRHAQDRSLRAHLYRAAATVGSELGAAAEYDNGPVLARILALRRE